MKHRRDITSIRISLVRGMGLEGKRTSFCTDYTKHSTGKYTNAGSGQSIAFFLANRNDELAVPPLFWPVNCIKIGGHVALLGGPTLYCDLGPVVSKAFSLNGGSIKNIKQDCILYKQTS